MDYINTPHAHVKVYLAYMGHQLDLGDILSGYIEEEAPYRKAQEIREKLSDTTCLLHGTVPQIKIFAWGLYSFNARFRYELLNECCLELRAVVEAQIGEGE